MKSEEFTPEFALFLLTTFIFGMVAVGLIFRLYIGAKGMTVTSWWRTPWKNADVGGASNSFHMLGLAWDVVPVTQENALILRNAGLRVLDEGDHLHAQIL